jgi:hypothetical protein
MVDRWRDGGSGLAIRCCHGAVINSTSSDSKNQTQILQQQQRQDTCRYANSSKGKTRVDTPTAAKARHVQIRQQQQRQDTCVCDAQKNKITHSISSNPTRALRSTAAAMSRAMYTVAPSALRRRTRPIPESLRSANRAPLGSVPTHDVEASAATASAAAAEYTDSPDTSSNLTPRRSYVLWYECTDRSRSSRHSDVCSAPPLSRARKYARDCSSKRGSASAAAVARTYLLVRCLRKTVDRDYVSNIAEYSKREVYQTDRYANVPHTHTHTHTHTRTRTHTHAHARTHTHKRQAYANRACSSRRTRQTDA